MAKQYPFKTLLALTVVSGMSVFSMFFGSGNLVFPLSIGINSGPYLFWGILGLIITGVLVPFIGLYGVIMYDGDKDKYFSTVHPYLPKIITALILALVGPFGVVPRCIVVAYGGVKLVFPDLALWCFSGVCCGLIFCMIKTKKQIIEVMGKYLTPFLLFGVAVITVWGIFSNDYVTSPANVTSQEVFFDSLLAGYNTMDLLAAFFFGITIKQYLNNILKGHTDNKFNKLCNLGTCIIAALLLTLVYTGFVFIGNKFNVALEGIAPESYLAHIASITLGEYSKYIAAITIALACFTTALILVRLFADFIEENLPTSITQQKYFNAQIIALSVSFILSLMGFKKIMVFLGGILSFLYPALIAIAVGNIIEKIFKIRIAAKLFWLVVIFKIALAFYG